MKILLFGKNGQVGWELNRSLQPLGEIVALARDEADFSSPESLREIVRTVNPDVIVNAVAYTAVDKAEAEEGLAATINGVAPGILAEAALSIKALLIHYSTDYVFDGAKKGPYIETDEPNPINAYGRTKLAGEQEIQSSGCDYLIFRTSWVYASRGHNFLFTILKLAKDRDELSVVADQIGSPTSARLIADTTAHCINQSTEQRKAGHFVSGVYHLVASGHTNWHAFSTEILNMATKELNLEFRCKKIIAASTTTYQTVAERPLNSRLKTDKLQKYFSVIMPDWMVSLKLCIEEVLSNN